MVRFRYPECGAETEVTAKYGDQVVSIYCLRHMGGADVHTRPVRMTQLPAAMGEPHRERALVLSPYRRSGRRSATDLIERPS